MTGDWVVFIGVIKPLIGYMSTNLHRHFYFGSMVPARQESRGLLFLRVLALSQAWQPARARPGCRKWTIN